jgi:hypothetical protein
MKNYLRRYMQVQVGPPNRMAIRTLFQKFGSRTCERLGDPTVGVYINQRPKHEASFAHTGVREHETVGLQDTCAVYEHIQIEGARVPNGRSFLGPPGLRLDRLEDIQQNRRLQVRTELHHRI